MSISWQNSETEYFFTTRFLNSMENGSHSIQTAQSGLTNPDRPRFRSYGVDNQSLRGFTQFSSSALVQGFVGRYR